MKIQTVLRDDGEDRTYTRISNALLQHPEIADDTLGMLCRLLSRPKNWEISIEGLIATSRGGKTKIRRQVEEARRLGFMLRHVQRDEAGKIERYVYFVSDNPAKLAEIKPLSGFQEAGKQEAAQQEAGEQEAGNQPQQRKESNKGKKEQTSCSSSDEHLRPEGVVEEETAAKAPTHASSSEPKAKRGKTVGSAAFDSFWNAYRSHSTRGVGSKQQAWTAFQKLSAEERAQATIMAPFYFRQCREDVGWRDRGGRPPVDACRYLTRKLFADVAETRAAARAGQPDDDTDQQVKIARIAKGGNWSFANAVGWRIWTDIPQKIRDIIDREMEGAPA